MAMGISLLENAFSICLSFPSPSNTRRIRMWNRDLWLAAVVMRVFDSGRKLTVWAIINGHKNGGPIDRAFESSDKSRCNGRHKSAICRCSRLTFSNSSNQVSVSVTLMGHSHPFHGTRCTALSPVLVGSRPFHNGPSSAYLSPFGGHVNGRCLTPHWSSLDSSGLLPGPRILGILFDRCRLVVVVIQKSSIDHPQYKKAKNSRFGQTDMDQWWRPQLAVAVHIPCQQRQFPYRAAISAQDENRMGGCRSRTNTVPHHPHYFIIYVCPVNNR